MCNRRSLYTLLSICAFAAAIGDDNCAAKIKVCNEKNTCEECRKTDPCCVWIYDKEVNVPRCNVLENFPETSFRKIIRGGKSRYKIIKDDDFSNPTSDLDVAATQIKPQKIKVYLRPGDPVTIPLSYKAAKNYPLDLYYMMDTTYSMNPHIQKVSSLGEKLANKLKDFTKNYKLAFGYYSDKVAMPYSSMAETYLENPCLKAGTTCHRGYNFVHALNFTNDIQEFLTKVQNISHTANMDDLEGGLDALMQVMLCKDELHWRKHSRKIVIMATDGLLHSAGDGILAGLTKRPNFRCGLVYDGNGHAVYDGLQFDYPSIEEVYRRLIDNKINVLFVIQEEIQKYYAFLNNLIPDVTNFGVLKNDSANILELVEFGYKKVIQQVNFKLKNDDNIQATFWSTCNSHKLNNTSTCFGIKIGERYDFDVTLELINDKMVDKLWVEEMNIKEFLEIDVEYLENCNCGDENDSEIISHGRYHCGKYICDGGWVGEKCDMECDRSFGRYKNATYTSTTCFNRGDFDINSCKCICDEDFTGDFCEFSQCGRNPKTNEICSKHGVCNEGNCICNDGYMGEICDCSLSINSCIAPKQEQICSGHGDCVCEKCVCNTADTFSYRGDFCEICPECKRMCDAYKEYVLAANDGRKINTGYMDEFQMNRVESFNDSDEFKCVAFFVKNDEKCTVTYTYELSNVIKINYKLDCSKPLNVAAVGLALVFVIFLALLLPVFIWKLITQRKDKKEFAKYLENRKRTTYNEENPLYKSPISTYTNPTERFTFDQKTK